MVTDIRLFSENNTKCSRKVREDTFSRRVWTYTQSVDSAVPYKQTRTRAGPHAKAVQNTP